MAFPSLFSTLLLSLSLSLSHAAVRPCTGLCSVPTAPGDSPAYGTRNLELDPASVALACNRQTFVVVGSFNGERMTPATTAGDWPQSLAGLWQFTVEAQVSAGFGDCAPSVSPGEVIAVFEPMNSITGRDYADSELREDLGQWDECQSFYEDIRGDGWLSTSKVMLVLSAPRGDAYFASPDYRTFAIPACAPHPAAVSSVADAVSRVGLVAPGGRRAVSIVPGFSRTGDDPTVLDADIFLFGTTRTVHFQLTPGDGEADRPTVLYVAVIMTSPILDTEHFVYASAVARFSTLNQRWEAQLNLATDTDFPVGPASRDGLGTRGTYDQAALHRYVVNGQASNMRLVVLTEQPGDVLDLRSMMLPRTGGAEGEQVSPAVSAAVLGVGGPFRLGSFGCSYSETERGSCLPASVCDQNGLVYDSAVAGSACPHSGETKLGSLQCCRTTTSSDADGWSIDYLDPPARPQCDPWSRFPHKRLGAYYSTGYVFSSPSFTAMPTETSTATMAWDSLGTTWQVVVAVVAVALVVATAGAALSTLSLAYSAAGFMGWAGLAGTGIFATPQLYIAVGGGFALISAGPTLFLMGEEAMSTVLSAHTLLVQHQLFDSPRACIHVEQARFVYGFDAYEEDTLIMVCQERRMLGDPVTLKVTRETTNVWDFLHEIGDDDDEIASLEVCRDTGVDETLVCEAAPRTGSDTLLLTTSNIQPGEGHFIRLRTTRGGDADLPEVLDSPTFTVDTSFCEIPAGTGGASASTPTVGRCLTQGQCTALETDPTSGQAPLFVSHASSPSLCPQPAATLAATPVGARVGCCAYRRGRETANEGFRAAAETDDSSSSLDATLVVAVVASLLACSCCALSLFALVFLGRRRSRRARAAAVAAAPAHSGRYGGRGAGRRRASTGPKMSRSPSGINRAPL